MMTWPYRYWLIAALLVALIYYVWGEITRTRRAPKVSIRPSAEACGNSGSLRYCVYRDWRGTNGDVVYHMHGRISTGKGNVLGGVKHMAGSGHRPLADVGTVTVIRKSFARDDRANLSLQGCFAEP